MNQKFLKTVDPVGSVFFEKGKVFRGINSNFEFKIKDILFKCEKLGLLGKSIIFTKETEFKDKLNEYPFSFFLEHEKIEPFTYPGEWSSNMIYDSGLMVLGLYSDLATENLILKDCHIFNTAFYKENFVWIDFGSIDYGCFGKHNAFDFIKFFLYPYLLFSKSEFKRASNFLKSGMHVNYEDLAGYLNLYEKLKIFLFKSLSMFFYKFGLNRVGFKLLKAFYKSFCKNNKNTRWKYYQSKLLNSITPDDPQYLKYIEIKHFIDDVKPKQLLDIGGNAGFYSFVASKSGVRSIILDIDDCSVDLSYDYLKKNDIKGVVPVVMDFLAPTPYWFNYSQTSERNILKEPFLSVYDRFKSDVVLALAVVHHLVFTQRVNFAEIVLQLRRFTLKYLIIEFVHKHDQHVKNWNHDGFEWYCIDLLEDELRKYFNIIKKVDVLRDERTLVFCSIKNSLNDL